jgi:hypothetical protein
MKIERVVIRGLRALEDRDDSLVGPNGPHLSVCLRGSNGSGKTTWLEALAELWQWFRRCTKRRAWVKPDRYPEHALLHEARLVAARLSGLPGPRSDLWLAWGAASEVEGLVIGEEDPPLRVVDGVPVWDPELLRWWDAHASRAEAGVGHVPNVVFIGAEDKVVRSLKANELFDATGMPAALALYRYQSQSKGPAHLEALISALKLVREDRFDLLSRWIRELLPGLELSGFDEQTRRPLFLLSRSGRVLTLDRLSAGERSVIINLVVLTRWLSPGGVVLLDEPELHQHISLMQGSMAVTEELVRQLGGQLLVASHAPEVWDHFRPRGALIDLAGRGRR